MPPGGIRRLDPGDRHTLTISVRPITSVVIDADTRLVVVVGRPLPGNRNDCKAWEESGAKAAVGTTMTIADGGYPGTGLVMPRRRRKGEELPGWKQVHNKSRHRSPR